MRISNQSMEEKYDIFISYSTVDKEVVEVVCTYLEINLNRCFVAFRDIPNGIDWADVIPNAIKNCILMVAICSTNFYNSEQTGREVSLAVKHRIPILPFRIDNEPMKGKHEYFLESLNRIDAYPNYKEYLQKLLSSIQRLIGKKGICNLDIAPSIPSKLELVESNKETILHFTVEGETFKMIFVEGGTFIMGNGIYGDNVSHEVELGDYYIGETVVTQSLWKVIMGNNPSHFKGEGSLPIECVSWNESQKFIRKLNSVTGKKFRLPTEAEWEYASRGGIQSNDYNYSGGNHIDEVAWYWQNSGNKILLGSDSDWNLEDVMTNNCRTHPVKQKKANELGLYDMSGNVMEWCQDWKVSYNEDSITDCQKIEKVCRGGSWYHGSAVCRVCYRSGQIPRFHYGYLGFRLVLDIE